MIYENENDYLAPPPPPRLAHTLHHAAELLDYSTPSLYRLHRAGKIRFVKIGGRTLVPDSEVRRLAEGRAR